MHMTERLNNEEIAQRIIDNNSDIKRYLNLAPGFKLTPPQPQPAKTNYNPPLSFTLLPRPNLRP